MLLITLLHGGKSKELSFPNEEDATVADVMSAVESEFNIHRSRQKLVYRGKTLVDGDSKLASHDIKSGSRILLIGKAEAPNPNELKKLNELEDDLHAMRLQMELLNSEMDSSSTRAEDIAVFVEQCRTNLRKARLITLPPSDVKYRKHRNDLIDSFQELIFSMEIIQAKLASLTNSNQ
ncbi:hypothetical protein Aperf_G00000074773 [Anoplocephala perfoliata]